MDLAEHFYIMGIINVCLCGLSMSASFIICIFYYKYTDMMKSFQAKLIFILALTHFTSALLSFIPSLYFIINRENIGANNSGISYAFGFFRVFFEYLGFGLTTIITYSLHLAINIHIDAITKQKALFIMLFMGTVILMMIPIAINNNAYGEADRINCWLMHLYSRFVFFVAWLILTFVNLFYILKIRKGLSGGMYNRDLEKTFSRKLIMIPMILFGCYLFNFIRRLCNLDAYQNGQSYDPISIVYLMFIFMPLVGIFNALVVGTIDEGVKLRLNAFFCCNMQRIREINQIQIIKNDNGFIENYSANLRDSLETSPVT